MAAAVRGEDFCMMDAGELSTSIDKLRIEKYKLGIGKLNLS